MAGEVGEARVGRQHEDQHRGRLDEEERDVADGAAPEDAAWRSAEMTVVLSLGTTCILSGQPRDADEHRRRGTRP